MEQYLPISVGILLCVEIKDAGDTDKLNLVSVARSLQFCGRWAGAGDYFNDDDDAGCNEVTEIDSKVASLYICVDSDDDRKGQEVLTYYGVLL